MKYRLEPEEWAIRGRYLIIFLALIVAWLVISLATNSWAAFLVGFVVVVVAHTVNNRSYRRKRKALIPKRF